MLFPAVSYVVLSTFPNMFDLLFDGRYVRFAVGEGRRRERERERDRKSHV